MGRKSLPDAVRKGDELRIRLTPSERKLLDQAAETSIKGESISMRGITSTWARDLLLQAARRVLRKHR